MRDIKFDDTSVILVEFSYGKKGYFYNAKALEHAYDDRTANFEETLETCDSTTEEGLKDMLNLAYPREGGVKRLEFSESIPEYPDHVSMTTR
jgi:hypothetical protein